MIGDQLATKPGTLVQRNASIKLKSKPRFVSRGGDKLAAALLAFDIQLKDYVCADIGASTGGFTDCLLQAGAKCVYAIDVGYGQLDWRIRNDKRVIVMERVNARYLDLLPEPLDLAVADVSFISLKLILPVIQRLLTPRGQVVVLVKPQFEAGKGLVGKGGVVRDPAVHRQVLEDVLAFSETTGFANLGLIPSPLRGPSGNIEFLLWLSELPTNAKASSAILIEQALEAASHIED